MFPIRLIPLLSVLFLAGCALPDPAVLGLQASASSKAPKPERTVELNALHNPDVDFPFVPATPDRLEFISTKVDGPYIAMTFDDGPHPTLTPRLLDVLAKRNVRCTFFVLGPLAKRYPKILRRMVAEGHEIANHTMTHRDIRRIPLGRMHKELKDCHEIIVEATGRKPLVFRPPGGGYNDRLMNIIHKEYGYATILWSVDSNDWRRPGAEKVAKALIRGAHNGAILLAHDIHTPTIKAIDGILKRGFTFVTMSQLIGLEKSREGLGSPTRLAAVRSLESFGPGDL